MIIALFIIAAAVVSTPIAATVVVSIASRREESALSLGEPAPGLIQAVARRVLDFSTECPSLPLPKSCGEATPALPVPSFIAQGSVGQPSRSNLADLPRPVAPSKVSIRTAA